MALADELKGLMGDVVVFYFRAHGYHWNVEGEDFSQYHGLFEDIYSDVYGSLDPLAENVRKLGEYAPFKLSTFQDLSSLEDSRVGTDVRSMASDLREANQKVLERLYGVFKTANEAPEHAGIANFLAERIDMHQKWDWQLKASTK